MGVERYNKLFGGGRGAAKKTLDQMRRTYGPKQGEHVFKGTVAKRERKAKQPKGGKR